MRPHLKELIPYASARDEFRGEGVFLDANENPYGTFNRYPDPYQSKLKEEISRLNNIETERIFLGNGSDEIIDLLFRIFCRPCSDKVVIFEPTFGMYETSARIHDTEVIKVPLNEEFQIRLDEELKKQVRSESVKLTFICSPNNPTGNIINRKEISCLLEQAEGMVVIDEAYIDFSSSASWLTSLAGYPNLIVLQTLSKAWGLAGLRVGMAFADKRVIGCLNKIKAPYNISSPSQHAALEKLNDRQKYRKQVEEIVSERARVAKALSACTAVINVYPSEANFLLIRVQDAGNNYRLLTEQGVIVRNRHAQVEHTLRISIGSPRENDRLITAFKNLA